MYHRLNKQLDFLSNAGFALATVLIASFSMMLILLAAVSSTVAIRSSITEQYYNKLAKTASDAGVEYAKACLAINGKPQWVNKNLTPATNCSGDVISGASDYVYTDGDSIKSSFSVSGNNLEILSSGNIGNISSSGKVGLFNLKNEAWREYANNSAVKRKYLDIKGTATTIYSSCGYTLDNRVFCWGKNMYGLLGLGSGEENLINYYPTEISIPALGQGETIASITSGGYNVCILTSGGNAYCWGRGIFRVPNFGSGDTVTKPDALLVIGKDQITDNLLKGKIIKDIKLGERHACVIDDDDDLYCWGMNNQSQLGINIQNSPGVYEPKLINSDYLTNGLAGKKIDSISLGSATTCAITANEELGYCWGHNDDGQTGNQPDLTNVYTPKILSNSLLDKKLKSISSGNDTSCAITSDNKAYCWGSQENGGLGNGLITGNSATPVEVNISNIPLDAILKSIKVGNNSACIIFTESQQSTLNKLACFGLNTDGQLGLGSNTDVLIPDVVSGHSGDALFEKNIEMVSFGYNHACAVSNNSEYCWGNNTYGQLGIGGIIAKNLPTQSLLPLGMEFSY